jgi:hypothetical protein
VVVVHGTRRFRDRVPGLAAAHGDVSTTALGAWYAGLLRWRRPVALLVNEATLLPLLMPLAPARLIILMRLTAPRPGRSCRTGSAPAVTAPRSRSKPAATAALGRYRRQLASASR